MAPNIGRVQQGHAIELNSPRRNVKGSAAGPIPVRSSTVLAHSIIDWSHSIRLLTSSFGTRLGTFWPARAAGAAGAGAAA
jgi:hypothetical protein